MASFEFPTFYCDVGYDGFGLRNLQCRGLQRAGIPLDFGNRSDGQGNLLKSTFTADMQTRDLLQQFEEAVGFTERILTAQSVQHGNFLMILDYINGNLSRMVRDDQRDFTANDSSILKSCYLSAFSRRGESTLNRESVAAYNKFSNLGIKPIRPGDLAEWLAGTYRLRLPEHLELADKVSEYQAKQEGVIQLPDIRSLPATKTLPFTS